MAKETKTKIVNVTNAYGDKNTTAQILVQNKIKYTPKVSVIVPCYNVSLYIERCLDSLINQTLADIEIICVDDRSTDNTLQIIQMYAKKDKRIKIIKHEVNKGVAVARNSALDVAKGEYIGFVDPDDYVDTNFYEKLYNAVVSTNSIVAKANVICFSNAVNDFVNYHSNELIKRDILYFSSSFWSAIYNRKFLEKHSIRFPDEIRTAQDTVFLTMVTINTSAITFVEDTFYHYYYQREGSLDSHKLPHWKVESKLNAFKLNLKYIEDSNLQGDRKVLAIERHVVTHALYECGAKVYENESDHRKMFSFLADVIKQYPDITYMNKKTKEYFIQGRFTAFLSRKNLKRKRLYLFHFIPFIKIDTVGSVVSVFLFDFLPIFKMVDNRKMYLFGIIPFIKIRG